MSNSENDIATPQHAPMKQLSVIDNCLQVGGLPLTEVAKQVGKTPFYAYDRAVMASKVATLRSAMPADLHLHYAMKANPMPEVVHYLGHLVW